MGKFVFKLQPLLNLKIQTEDSLKNELGKAIQKLEAEKGLLRQIEDEREGVINRFTSVTSQGIPVGKIKEYNSYISFLKEKIELQKENVNFAQNVVDNYREQLIKVMQEKEMLEKLKDKKYRDYLKEQLREEQKMIDEVVSFKYNNNFTKDNE